MRTGNEQSLVSRLVGIVDWRYDGEELVYDIEVEGPYHNFYAGGVFVHNCLNEYSARYSVLKSEYYLPRIEDIAQQSTSNKQGRGVAIAADQAEAVRNLILEDTEQCFAHYRGHLNLDENDEPLDPDGISIARELARIGLTLNTYTEWYWKIDLHNLMRFLTQRTDPHAQYEVRVFANVIAYILKLWMPNVYQAWVDYQKEAVTLPGPVIRLLLKALGPAGIAAAMEQIEPTYRGSNLRVSKREMTALQTFLRTPTEQ